MKKIISILACVCLLLSVMIVPIAAAETSATITFDDKAKRTEYSTSIQVWEENGIKVINNKGASTSNVGDYANPGRFYKNSELIIEYPSMTKIEVNANAAKYATPWEVSNTDTNATVTVSGSVATIVFATPVDSYTINLTNNQSRVDSMTVYAAPAAGACAHDETTTTSNGDETHSVVCNSCGETVNTKDCQDNDLDGACDTCTGDVALPATLTITEAVALGEEQASNAYTTDKYLVTGQITAIANTQYGNMYIADEEGNEIYIYGMYSADGSVRYDGLESKPDEGDTVKVLSTVGNYNGTAQLKNVWLIDFTAGELEPTTPDPEADTALTIEEAIALGESKKSNVYTEGKYYVTGVVTEVYNEDYGNMYIADENGNTLTIYGTYSADGSTGYAGMETKPVAGDTITVYGIIGQYNGTAQMKNGWITEIVTVPEETFEGTDPEAPIELAVNESVPATLKEIKVPAAGTVYVKAADANGILHVTSATGSYMLINGMANQATADAAYDLTLCGYEMVNIYNPGEETITLYVFLEAGAGEVVGTWDNPEVLEFMENPYMPQFPPSAEAQTELEAGNQGYFYKVIAPKDCILVINISAIDAEWNGVGYQYSVTNNTTSWQSDFVAMAPDADDYSESVFVTVNAGDEIIINAGTFNPSDVWNAPEGTLNVRINTTTVGSSDYPEILTETGTYTATVEAGSQYYYEYTVEADGVLTVTMNDENWTYVVNNLTSYVYGDTQWSDSDPVVPETSIDVTAGDLISIMVAPYDPADPWNAPAGTVNWTLAWSEKVEEPAVPGVFSIDDVDTAIGEEFQVVVNISENPGIIGATLNINYDANLLELVSAVAGDLTNGSEEKDEVVLSNYNFGPIENNPFAITWVDALAEENIATNGVFVTLTFKVKEDATAGTTDITITADADDIFDKDFNNVEFTFDGATVTIADNATPGDVNGDGNINARDYAMLIQHLNGWEVTIDEDAADVNGDGNINARDYAMLIQYLNGWPVELK